MDESHPAYKFFFITKDPQAPISSCPALTTLLYKVRDGDQAKFEEATRLVELFMADAYMLGLNTENK